MKSLCRSWGLFRPGPWLAWTLTLAWLLALPRPMRAEERVLRTVPEIVEAYLAANGGRENVETIQSLRLVGVVQEGDLRYDLILIKKRPNLKRLVLRYQGRVVHLGYDGQTAWRRVTAPGVDETVELSGQEAADFIAETEFDGPLVDYERRGLTVELAAVETWGRLQCYVLRLRKNPAEETLLYLDTATLREVRSITRRLEGGQTVEIETIMGEYRKFQDIWLAMRVERLRDGKTASLMEVQAVELNAGVFDGYFRKPPSPSSE